MKDNDDIWNIEQVRQYLGQQAFLEFDHTAPKREINRRCEDCYYKKDVMEYSAKKFTDYSQVD